MCGGGMCGAFAMVACSWLGYVLNTPSTIYCLPVLPYIYGLQREG